MKIVGRCSVYDFLGDSVVYRNLIPVDRRLPGLERIGPQVGLAPGRVPRKSEPAYAEVIVAVLRAARALDAEDVELERLVFLGDTRLNDGTAFANIARAGGWPGLGVIIAERDEAPKTEVVREGDRTLYFGNRWGMLGDLESLAQEQGLPLDERTAVVIDLDKTTLGARGRNDRVIDQARVEAVRRTVGGLLGDQFDVVGFRRAYDLLNQPEFHRFTADNQDYLAYICLILGAGLFGLENLVDRVEKGELGSIRDLIEDVEDRRGELSPPLREIHADVRDRVRGGDPTPFKAFRRQEYRATIERMGCMADESSVAELLASEITITHEVRAAADRLREVGALLFALSDKPDEASLPTEDLAAQGWEPIHRTPTHAVGGE